MYLTNMVFGINLEMVIIIFFVLIIILFVCSCFYHSTAPEYYKKVLHCNERKEGNGPGGNYLNQI
jgi:hypothetical protein